ncbi:hypothetical protein JQ554_14880 [Bradyrhizobium diazoefficiens]|nr:hypothetical protein [Bradyrhizobium diazoefficiens]UCF53776.1 MAG: hypothetical protein JSV48_05145 [Bradyrhizobium sp.]MBR0964873.1 hypothetical protein [Bradyrhizobium diazoefficiens]MBR0976574.1 hypothetical protein [Bradyrhizobium diazoefficiens]MBR1008324.1 hypothetical protein [Bradyrhizobium diazoefficiens]MBR1014833.1 hypothetical protein [Bradyrhizobium diazoefficiens]
MVLRIRTIVCGAECARCQNASKHDAYHTKSPISLAVIAAQIRENHGLSRCPRKYASPEISTLHRFASI